jgi:hypothetical protein
MEALQQQQQYGEVPLYPCPAFGEPCCACCLLLPCKQHDAFSQCSAAWQVSQLCNSHQLLSRQQPYALSIGLHNY